MEQILRFISDNNIAITFLLIILVAVLIIILLITSISSSVKINRLNARYRKFMIGTSSDNIEEIISKNIEKIKETYQRYNEIEELIKESNDKRDRCIQNIGFIRFRAFDDVGGELSYALALLDQNKDGILLSSIFGRNQSTTYAKLIENGTSKIELSDEENEALQIAISKAE